MNPPTDSVQGALPASSRQGLNKTIAKLFFGLGCGVSLLGALVYGKLDTPLHPGMRAVLVANCLALAALLALAIRLLDRVALGTTVLLAGWAGTALIVLAAVGLGDGVHSQSLGFLGLTVSMVTAVCGLRSGVLLAIASALAMGLLGAAESAGWLPVAAAGLHRSHTVSQAILAALLLTACLAGAQVSHVVNRAMADAAEREERFRNLLAIAADWYWELDTDLRLSRVDNHLLSGLSSVADKRLGLRPWEAPGIHIDPAVLALHLQDLQARRPFSDLPVRYESATSGRVLHFSMSGRPRFDADGEFCGYWGVSRDVSAELRTQEAHSASESRYRELFSLSPTPLVLHRDGVTMLANEAAAHLFGFASADAMQGFDMTHLYSPALRPAVYRRRKELAQLPIGERLEMIEVQLNTIDGRVVTVHAGGARVNMPDGPAMLTLTHDVTARVATEAALRRSEAMLSHLFAFSPDFITLSDMATGVYVMVNDSFLRLFGYTLDEVVGKSSIELGLWRRPADRERLVSLLKEGGGVNEMEALFVAKSGQLITLLMSAGRFTLDGRDYLVVNSRDVTEAQRTRLEHEAILKNASIGIALTRGRRFMQANPSFEAMFGWPLGELLGQPDSVVWGSEEALAEANRITLPLLADGKQVEIERQMVRRDGGLFWCRLLGQVVDTAHPSGLGGTIWIAEDVTERRQIDQALAAARDVAEAANRAKSAFLANTSHEIRTPLNGLLGLATLAMQPNLEATRRQQYLEQIQDSAQSLAGIISDILDLSKIEAGKFSVEAVPFDLHGLLRAVHHAYQSLGQARSLEITLAIASDVPATVIGDPLRLRQILSNYLTNGLKFTMRGRLQIEVAMSAHPGEPQHVRFTVSDTGEGVDEATQQRLFQPFTQADSSTTRRFGGTGLGLSICKALAELMGGRVGMQSAPGQGSRFWAELPLPETDSPVIDPHAEAQDLARLVGLRVLMVEDNAVNMMIGVALLEQWGVHVTQAVDGQAGLAAVERAFASNRPFDVVLMDVQMPRMSGHEATRQLRQRHSAEALPIIALTAAALVSERDEALAAGMNDFLTKPIDAHRLRQALLRLARRTS